MREKVKHMVVSVENIKLAKGICSFWDGGKFCYTLLTAHVVFSLLEPLLVFTTLQRSSLAANSVAMSTADCGLRECLLGW